jgi:hypothetical protein
MLMKEASFMAGHGSKFAYWIGVFMVIVCVAAALAEYLPRRIGFGDISLVWLAGGAALLSFLVYELMDSVAGTPADKKPRQPESEIHAAEFPAEAPNNQQAVSSSERRDRVTTGTGRTA